MNLTWIDLAIVVAVLAFMVGSVLFSKSYMRSVSDFLAAGRTGGRYLISVSMGIAMLGAITIVANFEMFYQSGFPMIWWGLTMAVVVLIVSVSGWIVYRFRQTRAMTMAQFFEVRYSRNFRVFTGLIAFGSGIVNFGIFPAVGARFFIYFCGLPPEINILGIAVSTFVLLMIFLLLISLFFVFVGGQIAVIVTDFIQGTFVNIIFVAIILFFFFTFDRSQIFDALKSAPENQSMVNPYKTSQAADFNVWYFLIGIVGFIYNMLSWQGTQGYNTSAKSAHEAKMGQVLSNWRNIPQITFMLFVAICAYAVMNNLSDFSTQADQVDSVLGTIENEAIKSQLTVPLVLTQFLPVGLIGAFAAVMLAAFISTHDTYLHSWGSIFIQDVVLPLRKKPLTSKQHIMILRLSIIGVAVFIFLFSLLFKQSEYILLFFAITGAIYAGGSGSVIIGGLYWKRGTTPAAWAAMITGSSIAVVGIIIHQCVEDFLINGQVFWFIAIVSSIAVYVVVSLLGKQQDFEMDKLLHRGKYAIEEDCRKAAIEPRRGLKMLGIGKEFTRTDKVIYFVTYGWIFSWFLVFVVGTIINLFMVVSDEAWMTFWYVFLLLNTAAAVAVIIWFTIGGVIDIKYMFRRLKTMTRDHTDDGSVH